MSIDIIKVGQKTVYKKDLPVQIDKTLMDSIFNKNEKKEPLTPEERIAYDKVANKIMDLLEDDGASEMMAFVIIQMPVINREIITSYIDRVIIDENAFAALFAVNLNRAVASEERNDELINIIINKGDIEVWIDAVKGIPQMPIEPIVRKVFSSNDDVIKLWNDEIGNQAKKAHDALKKQIGEIDV